MNNFARAHNAYLEPPDEPEAVFCEECGEEMVREWKWSARNPMQNKLVCRNKFCPAKFEGDAKEMAYMLIGATEEVKSLARQLKRIKATGLIDCRFF